MRLSLRLLLLVFHLPFLSFGQLNIGPDSNLCITTAPFQLRTNGNSFGGTWTSNPAGYVTPTGVFNPRAGIPFPPTGIEVTYTVAGQSGTRRFGIASFSPFVEAGKDTMVCAGVPLPLAIGMIPQPGITYRWWRQRPINGPGIPANGLDNTTNPRPTVNLPDVTGRDYRVKYFLGATPNNGGCTSYDSVIVTVFPRTSVQVRRPGLRIFCASNDTVLLPQGTPTYGLWYGAGIVNRYPGLFIPSRDIAGAVVLDYRTPCNVAPGQQNIFDTVFVLDPQSFSVDAGPNQEQCVNLDSLRLTGFPAGGRWIGPGIRADGWIVRPARSLAAPAPNNPTKWYKYCWPADTGVCKACDSMQITWKDYPNVRPANNLTLCNNDDPTELTGASPAGGIYTNQNPATAGLISGNTVAPGVRRYDNTVSVIRYTFTAPNGCSNFAESFVTINKIDTANVGSDTSVCANARSFNLTGATPQGGSWSSPDPRANNLFRPAGGSTIQPNPTVTGVFKYIYTIVARGCTSKDSLNITFLQAPQNIRALPRDTTVCANSRPFSLRGTPAGGKFFNRAGRTPAFGIDTVAGRFLPAPSLEGTQTIYYIVKSAQGCPGRDSLTVNVRPIPRVNLGTDLQICSMRPRDSIALGIDTITWSNGNRFTYQWSGSQGTQGLRGSLLRSKVFATLVNTDTGIVTRRYTLRVTNTTTNCTNTDTLAIAIVPRPQAIIIVPRDTAACQGDSITLVARRPLRELARYQYQWYTRNNVLTPRPTDSTFRLVVRESGRYFLRVFDTTQVSFGLCSDTTPRDRSINIRIKPRLNPTIAGKPDFCAKGQDTLIARPAFRQGQGVRYQWLRNGALIQNAVDTLYNARIVASYRVILTDSRFGVTCTDTSASVFADSITVPFNNVVVNGTDTTFSICANRLPFTVTAPIDSIAGRRNSFLYRWQDGSTRHFFTIDTTGNYFVQVFNQCGSATDTIRVSEVLPVPVNTILRSGFPDTTVCKDIPWRLRSPDGLFANWGRDPGGFDFPDAREQDIATGALTPDSSRVKVWLRVESPEGCVYTDTIRYRIENCTPEVDVPTAFTPQNDGVNEKWVLRTYSVSDSGIRVYVYNRWGQQVYFAGSLRELENNPWDGTYKGQPCLAGAYRYIILFSGPNKDDQSIVDSFERKGTVTIIR